MHAKVMGLPNLPLFVEPAHLSAGNADHSNGREQARAGIRDEEELRQGIEELVRSNVDQIIAALTRSISD
jgi:hypothetical protein